MRGANLVKLLRAVDLISRPQGATVKELMEHLEIDRSSVYRLKETMEELGFPVVDEQVPLDKRKRIKLIKEFQQKLPNITLPDIKLTLSEIIALHLLRGEERVYRGTEVEKQMDAALGKVGMFVPELKLKLLGRIKTLFVPTHRHLKDYSAKEEIIDTLMTAMLQERSCHITYHSFSRENLKSYDIDPLYFFENEGGLYIFAQVPKYEDVRIYAVERFQGVKLTDKRFDYPEDFNPEDKLKNAFNIVYDDEIDVRIRFSEDQARYIKERQWAKAQNIVDEPDGSIILEMTTSGWWDVKRWVLSFGDRAEVLEPVELRKEMVEEVSSISRLYSVNARRIPN